MRLFNRYAPLLVAKHVSRLFSGRVYISGRGGFQFTNGWLQVPSEPEIRHYKTVKEVNAIIRQLHDKQLL